MNAKAIRPLVILPLTAMLAAACGAGSGGSSNAGAPAASGSPSGVNPNAPETNPAGDIPDNTVYVPYQPPSGSYTIKVPEGWAKTTKGATVVFTDKLNSVTLEQQGVGSAPTVATAKSQTVPQLKSSTTGFQLVNVTTVHRTAGTVVEVHYQATSAPNAVTGKTVRDDVQRYEYYRSGTEVDVTLSGPVGADNVDPWRTITDSFRWR